MTMHRTLLSKIECYFVNTEPSSVVRWGIIVSLYEPTEADMSQFFSHSRQREILVEVFALRQAVTAHFEDASHAVLM